MGAGKCSASRSSFARWMREVDRIRLNPTLLLKNVGARMNLEAARGARLVGVGHPDIDQGSSPASFLEAPRSRSLHSDPDGKAEILAQSVSSSRPWSSAESKIPLSSCNSLGASMSME